MSETQVLASTLISDIKKLNESESGVQSAAAAENNDDAAAIKDEEDLEDGEIDDDDDEENNDNDAIAMPVSNTSTGNSETNAKYKVAANDKLNSTPENVVTIDLSDDNGQSTSVPAAKSKKPKPIEDDHLSSIEYALANALKKKGIEPIAPVLETHIIDDNDEHRSSHQSKSSRRRKRKRQREEKEKKEKSHSEKKKSRYDSPEPSKPIAVVDLDDELMDDDFEMLNVRGGSPPPVSQMPMQMMPTGFGEQRQSDYESDYSYDSYDSANDDDSPRNESRRRRRNKKDKKRRDRGGRNENRHRRESPERQEPRKLELCKFYLLECCAKRDKCSYMHGDFPCKYYYLGMDCLEKDDCKFSHGEPLTEQLRNILIKHLEMAPKEILGNFKRIPRDQAISMITKRHEELCKEYKVENSWSNLTSLPSNFNRAGKQQQQQKQQQKQKQQHPQQQQLQQQQSQLKQQQQNASGLSNIPSLLDMVIKPPNELTNLAGNNSPSHERQRKSRWNDNSSLNDNHREAASPLSVGPSYLDIKNLNGILSEEHIAALSAMGIINLEQVNQLTVGRLNQIGLTIAEINEIQLNAKNMAQLGGLKPTGSFTEATTKLSPKTEFSSTQPANSHSPNVDKKSSIQKLQESEICCTNSNSNSNSGVVMVDYTQYLKDSHLPFDRNDDDERDDEQLIIDDGNLENDDNPFGSSSSKSEMKKRKDSQSDSEQHQSHHQLSVPTLQMSDFGTALRNPFSAMNPFNKSPTADPRTSKRSSEAAESKKKHSSTRVETDSDDERYYASRGRRSRSVTPPPNSGSSTPEASQSPRLEDFGSGDTIAKPKQRENPKYERHTMYDFDIKRAAEEDEARAAKSVKADKDMRFPDGARMSGGGDIDLRLPFLPVTNYTPATEIDASITSHLPMTFKVHEVDVKPPSYVELRQNFKSDQTSDPRLRRILGLPETSQTRTSAAVLSRNVRKLSNTIASPESSDGASPKYYTPPMSGSDERSSQRNSSQKRTMEEAATKPQPQQLRMDPRRAARQNAEAQQLQSSPPTAAATPAQTQPNNAVKQNVEIRNHLQKSDWYKNLNSKFKIMVNQQLALVSTELKKFHQDTTPNKIFDISFITNNATLQQILTQLGIYIDDNGEVAHIDGDEGTEEAQSSSQEMTNSNNAIGNSVANILLPNLSQPPPTQSQQQQPIMDFLRGPPPTILQNAPINLQKFTAPPPNVRPSLLGIPPAVPPRNPFNPFAQNIPINPFVGGPSLLGPGPGAPPIGFNSFNAPPAMQQQRNLVNNGNQQRNQRNQRRNNNSGSNK